MYKRLERCTCDECMEIRRNMMLKRCTCDECMEMMKLSIPDMVLFIAAVSDLEFPLNETEWSDERKDVSHLSRYGKESS